MTKEMGEPVTVTFDSVTSNPLTNESNSDCDKHIPPEIVDKILEKLETKDLLTCRLVNHNWKALSEKVLQDRASAYFTTWNGYNHQDVCIPTLRKTHNLPNIDQYSAILGNCKDPSRNPLPSCSIRIVLEKHSGRCPPQEFYRFFSTFGHHVKHLILVNYQAYYKRFLVFLSKFPNIKSLALEGVCINNDDYDIEDERLLILPKLEHLTHLRISSTVADMETQQEMTIGPFEWIIENYNSQIVGLTILGHHFLHICTSKLIEGRNGGNVLQFGMLKQLRINFRNSAVLKLVETASLTNLHIMGDDDAHFFGHYIEFCSSACLNRCCYYNASCLYCRLCRLCRSCCTYCVKFEHMDGQLVELLQPFAPFLIYLRMSNKICYFKQSKPPLCFPKLKTLGIRAPEDNDESVTINEVILPAASTSLTKLEFIHYNDVVPFINKQVCVSICSKLEVLSMFDGRKYIGVGMSHASRTNIIWKKEEHKKKIVRKQ